VLVPRDTVQVEVWNPQTRTSGTFKTPAAN